MIQSHISAHTLSDLEVEFNVICFLSDVGYHSSEVSTTLGSGVDQNQGHFVHLMLVQAQ